MIAHETIRMDLPRGFGARFRLRGPACRDTLIRSHPRCPFGRLRVMNLFGLDAPSIMARVRASPGGSKPPLLTKSLAIGMLGFGAASLVVFGMWAFAGRAMYRYFGEAGAYAAWAIMFVALAGGVLNPLVIGPQTLGRFYGLFTLAFGAYALWWSLSWFVLKDRAGEWVGSLLGSVALGWILTWGFAAGESGCVSSRHCSFCTRPDIFWEAFSLHSVSVNPGRSSSANH